MSEKHQTSYSNYRFKSPETNYKAIEHFRRKQNRNIDIETMYQGIIHNDITQLGRSLTLVESTQTKYFKLAQALIQKCLLMKNESIRIGITGVPGAGKSTFIEALGHDIIKQEKKIAILAVDPSSTLSGGSILGDKTRMGTLVGSPNVFIRPSPTGNSLGGVARKTKESIILCEAAGYDVIIIETVGVGQSEIAVHGMVDFFLLLQLTGAGDGLQGIKRGIIEMADTIVINKADGPNKHFAQVARNQLQGALHLNSPKSEVLPPKVLICSALENEGIKEILDYIEKFIRHSKKSGYFGNHREAQNHSWLSETIEEALLSSFFNHSEVKEKLIILNEEVRYNKITPFAAAEKLLALYRL